MRLHLDLLFIMDVYQGGERGQFSALACSRDRLGSGDGWWKRGPAVPQKCSRRGERRQQKCSPRRGEKVKNKQAVQ